MRELCRRRSPKVGNSSARQRMRFQLQRKVHQQQHRQQLKELKEHSWRRLITAAGTCEITQATECRWEKASLTLCHVTARWWWHTHCKVSCRVACVRPTLDSTWILLPCRKLAAHITHIPHIAPVWPSNVQTVHSLGNILCSVLYAKCASGVIFHRGIWHRVDWKQGQKPNGCSKYWIYRNWHWRRSRQIWAD